MAKYYILLKASGGPGLPEWLPYRLESATAEEAVAKAKREAALYYPQFDTFEVQVIEIERRST